MKPGPPSILYGMELIVRRGSWAIAALAWLTAFVLALQSLSDSQASNVSDVVFPLVGVGAGFFMCLGAFSRSGRSRLAWLLLGLGVTMFGMGELIWAWHEMFLGAEPPFPGPPDVFYLLGYPLLVGGVLVTPRLAPSNYQRGQQVIDIVVVVSGLSILAWLTVLVPVFRQTADVSPSELLVGAAYPLGDIFLLATIGVVGIRRSIHIRDYSMWCVLAGLVAMAIGDFLYLVAVEANTYASGTWLDATWLVSYGLFAASAYWLTMPVEARREREGRLPTWHALVPVVVVMSINGFHLYGRFTAGESIAIEAIMTVLAFLILGRLLMIVAEDRHLVEEDRRRLISVVSHELRTPLTAVDGYLDIVLGDWEGIGDDEKRQMIEIAQEQARLVTRIVTDLVETSRNNLHSTKLQLESVDVGDLVGRVGRQFEFGARFEPQLEPGCTIEADRRRLVQIVTNLVSNAERYGAGGPIVGTVRRVDDQIELAVHDSGPGVPRHHRERVWGAFERGVHRFDASTPGSGLGLAIVRSLVDAHGGTVGYRESERLGGACFWVRFPYQPVASARLGTLARTA